MLKAESWIDEPGAMLLTAIIAAMLVIWQVAVQRNITRRLATLEHLRQAENDKDLIGAKKEFLRLAKEPNGGLAPYAALEKATSDETHSINMVLNHFEMISIGIQLGTLDYEFYRRWYKSSVQRYWEIAAPYVTYLRARVKNQSYFHEFEEMSKWMADSKMPRRAYNQWGIF